MKRNFIVSITIAAVATLTVGFVNVTPTVIYGDDNRKDIYEVPEAVIREVADSTVAVVYSGDIVQIEDGRLKITTVTFGNRLGLCSDEPFRDQPTAANCSGSLVGPDLVATAGHCINSASCSSYKFVFGFRMMDKKNAQDVLPESEVYSCKEVVAREYTSGQDYALVRLDRVVLDRKPLTLQERPASPGDLVYVVGHPAGLPTKFADGAVVRAQRGSYFQTNLDTYGGNSGSAVFNAKTHEVVGILVRGTMDFVHDSAQKCTRSNVCTDTGCRGEDVTNISYISEAIKATRR